MFETVWDYLWIFGMVIIVAVSLFVIGVFDPNKWISDDDENTTLDNFLKEYEYYKEFYEQELKVISHNWQDHFEETDPCEQKYELVVKTETYSFYVPYNSTEAILGELPPLNESSNFKIKRCIKYYFRYTDTKNQIIEGDA